VKTCDVAFYIKIMKLSRFLFLIKTICLYYINIQDLINVKVKSQQINATKIRKTKTIGKFDLSRVLELHDCLQHQAASPAVMARAIRFGAWTGVDSIHPSIHLLLRKFFNIKIVSHVYLEKSIDYLTLKDHQSSQIYSQKLWLLTGNQLLPSLLGVRVVSIFFKKKV
jgi:hypothetical protein